MKTTTSPHAIPRERRGGGTNDAPPILRRYFKEMGATPLLNQADEARIAHEFRDARAAIAEAAKSSPSNRRKIAALTSSLDAARDLLILANLRLVVHIAKDYANRGIPFMDLIQEGNLGLIRAVEGFEPERGHRFSTYAFWWIKQGIERAIADKSRTIRVPVHVGSAVRTVENCARELGQQLGRKATNSEIAARLGMPEDVVEETFTVVREPISLEVPAGEGGGFDAAHSIPDTQAPSPLDHVTWREIKEKVELALEELSPRERRIVRARFGIGRDAPRTLEEIGEMLGLSRERVRQLETAALRKIKESPVSGELADLLGLTAH